MKESVKIKQELQAQGAERLLEQQGRVPDWELPPDYLAGLTDRVLASTTVASTPKQAVAVTRRLPWRSLAAAAAVFLALGLWYFQSVPTAPTSPTAASWDDISTEALQAYLDDHLDDFDLELLATYTTAVDETLPGQDISTEALEDYLETEALEEALFEDFN